MLLACWSSRNAARLQLGDYTHIEGREHLKDRVLSSPGHEQWKLENLCCIAVGIAKIRLEITQKGTQPRKVGFRVAPGCEHRHLDVEERANFQERLQSLALDTAGLWDKKRHQHLWAHRMKRLEHDCAPPANGLDEPVHLEE